MLKFMLGENLKFLRLFLIDLQQNPKLKKKPKSVLRIFSFSNIFSITSQLLSHFFSQFL